MLTLCVYAAWLAGWPAAETTCTCQPTQRRASRTTYPRLGHACRVQQRYGSPCTPTCTHHTRPQPQAPHPAISAGDHNPWPHTGMHAGCLKDSANVAAANSCVTHEACAACEHRCPSWWRLRSRCRRSPTAAPSAARPAVTMEQRHPPAPQRLPRWGASSRLGTTSGRTCWRYRCVCVRAAVHVRVLGRPARARLC